MCISKIFSVIQRIQKWSQKQQGKNIFRLLIAIAFRYHHYERFYSQIDLTKLTIVNGEPGNSLNKCINFLDAAPLKGCVRYIFASLF